MSTNQEIMIDTKIPRMTYFLKYPLGSGIYDDVNNLCNVCPSLYNVINVAMEAARQDEALVFVRWISNQVIEGKSFEQLYRQFKKLTK